MGRSINSISISRPFDKAFLNIRKFSPFAVYFKDSLAWQLPLFSLKHPVPSLNSLFNSSLLTEISITKKYFQGLPQALSIFLRANYQKIPRQQISLPRIQCCLTVSEPQKSCAFFPNIVQLESNFD